MRTLLQLGLLQHVRWRVHVQAFRQREDEEQEENALPQYNPHLSTLFCSVRLFLVRVSCFLVFFLSLSLPVSDSLTHLYRLVAE